MDWPNMLQSKKISSREIAFDRLQLMVIHDRAGNTAQLLEMMQNDIFKVITSYMEIDENGLNVQISHQNDPETKEPMTVLSAVITIKNMRKQRI